MLTATLLLTPSLFLGVRTQSIEARVEATLQQLTTDEKLDLIGGVDGFYIRDIPRLGLPRVKMSDGPVGVRNYGPTTAYPAGLALAAAFDPDLAKRFGVAIGRDSRARGVHIWLAPGVNLARVPQNGRNFEYLGEDPLVAGRIAAGLIQGVQSQGVVATVKHFAGNEHESDRNVDSSDVDERTLRELYLKPFEIAVKDGKVWAVMSGYNKLNGTYCSENSWLVQQVLKKEWGFKGLYMSDWGAAHSTLGTVNNGLDLEMPGGDFMNPKTIRPLLDSGKVKIAAIDDKVRCILRVTYAMGFADREQSDNSIPLADPQNEAVSLEMARAGVVLLKNQGAILPISRTKVRNIVVVGPNGDPAVTGGGGSSYTTPTTAVSLVEAIRKVAGRNVKVTHFAGTVRIQDAIEQFHPEIPGKPGVPGYRAEYFANKDLTGPVTAVQTERRLSHEWHHKSPADGVPAYNFSTRWTAEFTATQSGEHLILARSDDGMRAKIDGKLVYNQWHDRAEATDQVSVNLEAGRRYKLEVEYYQGTGEATAMFGIVPARQFLDRVLPEAPIRSADLVVLATGLNQNMEGEGFDRAFDLPADQQALIRRAVELNPRTVLVNNSGGPVDIAPFEPKLPGILQAWYPGGLGNLAVAEILFGDTNPSGHLPLSWPRTLTGTYYASAYPPVNHRIAYKEGLFMGYRWFDKNGKAPLFPFGHGLSYTKFAVSKPTVRRTAAGIEATVTIRNTGARAGSETLQAYTGYVKSAVPRPVRELKAFRRVALNPGESTTVRFSIPRADLAYYDVKRKQWVVEPGQVEVAVGTSSRALAGKSVVKL